MASADASVANAMAAIAVSGIKQCLTGMISSSLGSAAYQIMVPGVERAFGLRPSRFRRTAPDLVL
jgi:hypothetical protein